MNLKKAEYDEKQKSFIDYWKKGGDDIFYAGFECIKERYGVTSGSCTDITGFPASGKTEFALEIQFYLSQAYGQRHAVYLPDVGNYNEVRRKLIHKYTGRGFIKKYPNYITEAEIIKAATWVDHHFIILEKKDIKNPVTPKDFFDFVADYRDNGGVLNTGLSDSWKNFFHEIKGREDQYLDYILSYRNELAEATNKHFFTIAHATKTELEDKTNSDGKKKRRIPDANDIKGGGSWFANGKSIITVDYADKSNNGADLYFSKIKPDTAGRSGAVIDSLFFDWSRSRYYEVYNGQKFYAGELKKYIEAEHHLELPQTSYYEPPDKDETPF